MLKAVFFDLDGTLVPCDTNDFVKGYFRLLAKYIGEHAKGIDVTKVGPYIMKAVEDVLKNDGTKTNKEAFWEAFFKLCPMYKDHQFDFKKICDHFYENEFDEAKYLLNEVDWDIDKVLAYIKDRDLIRVLATSPVFPRAATNKRVNWIGHRFEEFDHITTYDNCVYCKPDLRYYKSLLEMFALKGEEVLMVGNDIAEDIKPAQALNMQTFYIDTYPLHDDGSYNGPKGKFSDLLEYLKKI